MFSRNIVNAIFSLYKLPASNISYMQNVCPQHVTHHFSTTFSFRNKYFFHVQHVPYLKCIICNMFSRWYSIHNIIPRKNPRLATFYQSKCLSATCFACHTSRVQHFLLKLFHNRYFRFKNACWFATLCRCKMCISNMFSLEAFVANKKDLNMQHQTYLIWEKCSKCNMLHLWKLQRLMLLPNWFPQHVSRNMFDSQNPVFETK